MLVKIATTLATSVVGAVVGFVLGFALAGPGGWLGPMPVVAAWFMATAFAILGLGVGTVLSVLSGKLEFMRDYVTVSLVSCLTFNLFLSLSSGAPTDGWAFLQIALLGLFYGVVYKLALDKFAKIA